MGQEGIEGLGSNGHGKDIYPPNREGEGGRDRGGEG